MKNEIKHIQLNKEKWDRWASWYDSNKLISVYLRKSQLKLISLLNIKENINFLDVGCGTGFAVGQVAKIAKFKGEFYGIDLSGKMIEKAKSNFSGLSGFHFIQANAESIPLSNNFFDIVICTNSFHHYLHPDKALKEIYRILKNGGKVYFFEPTGDNLIAKIADKILKLVEPQHVKMYSTEEFQLMFECAGLKYISPLEKSKTRSKIHIGQK
jgi:ubiquinone/menaquinone biosynthesis C-methylase UbiE